MSNLFLWLTKNFFMLPGEIGIDKKTRIWWNGGRIHTLNTVEGTDLPHEGIYRWNERRWTSAWTAGWPRPSPPPAPLAQKYIRLKRVKLNGRGQSEDVRLAGGLASSFISTTSFSNPPHRKTPFSPLPAQTHDPYMRMSTSF